MVNKEFLERLRNYLNERFKEELKRFKEGEELEPFKIDMQPLISGVKWHIWTPETIGCRHIDEYEDGTIKIESDRIANPGIALGSYFFNTYRSELSDVLNKDSLKLIRMKADEKEKEVLEDLIHRRNFEEHLEKPYGWVFANHLLADEIAEKVSRKIAEVTVSIKGTVITPTKELMHATYFISRFDCRNVSEEEIFEEIKKRVEAVFTAYEEYCRRTGMNRSLLEKLRNYFNEKYKNDAGFKPFKIDMQPIDAKWRIRTYGSSNFGVEGLDDGKIRAFSHAIGVWDDAIYHTLMNRVYRYRLKKAKTKEEDEKIFKMLHEEKNKILEDIVNRKWEKYLDERCVKKYGYFITELFWEEEVARRISKKYNVEIKLDMDLGYNSGFSSVLDPTSMTEEQIFNEIVKRADAIYVAYMLGIGRTKRDYEEKRKFYEEFQAKLKKQSPSLAR